METVEDLRNQLVALGMSREEADAIKGKKQLYESLAALTATSKIDTVAVIQPTKVEKEEKNWGTIPSRTDPDWHDYVMSQFTEDELYTGTYPKLFGLRRVAELLMGEIVDSGPISSTFYPDSLASHCVYAIKFADGKTFRSVADVNEKNVKDDVYSKYPTTIAEARAEARLFRKALGLRVCSAEEIGDTEKESYNSVLSGEYNENDKASEAQISVLKNLCNTLGINPEKFITATTRAEAKELIKKITEYQKKPDSIPEELK